MRRTDRLFDLIQILRDGRLHRAQDMADRLGVSTRTLWRDMATLMETGLPVEGERGVGYILRAPITLPPMILTAEELEALRTGVRLVAEGDDATLARAARGLASKIATVSPVTTAPGEDELFVFSGEDSTRASPHIPLIRSAIRAHERIAITYVDETGRQSHRDIRPLVLEFAGKVWNLAAWCEAARDFRSFRIDRIVAMTPTGEVFPNDPGTTLTDYRATRTERPDT